MVAVTASDTSRLIVYPGLAWIGASPTLIGSFITTEAYTGSFRLKAQMQPGCDDCAGPEPTYANAYFYKNGVQWGTAMGISAYWGGGAATCSQDYTSINIPVGTTIALYVVSDGNELSYSGNSFQLCFNTAGTTAASFTSSPTGAALWVNGTNTGLSTPCTYNTNLLQTYNFTLKKTGYVDYNSTFTLVNSGVTTTVPLATMTGLGSLAFSTTPTGAQIWIDGVNSGVATNGTIPDLLPGSKSYSLRKVGYLWANGTTTVVSGSTVTVPLVTLATAIDVIASNNIKYRDDATVIINPAGYAIRKTITITEAISGTIKFYYEMYNGAGGMQLYAQLYINGIAYGGYNSHLSSGTLVIAEILVASLPIGTLVQLWAGSPNTGGVVKNFRVQFDYNSGASFTSSPSGGRIWINGVDKGVNTPNTIIDIVPAAYTYTIKLANYIDGTGNFNVYSGTITTVPLVILVASSSTQIIIID